tara:strand:+ start:1231 stop:1665 length:435 start_codon:yes stop_codon:yes gene_type:complete
MAKDNIIQFPNKKEQSLKQKVRVMQARIDEIDVENKYIEDDIAYLKESLRKNHQEAENILKEFAIINGENFFSAGDKPVMDFENEWGDDFEFTPDFDIPDKPNKRETEWDELGDKLHDAAKKLEDAVVQLVLDLDINKDKPEDK